MKKENFKEYYEKEIIQEKIDSNKQFESDLIQGTKDYENGDYVNMTSDEFEKYMEKEYGI